MLRTRAAWAGLACLVLVAAGVAGGGLAGAREPEAAYRLQGRVIGVVDGDTVRLDTGARRWQVIRLSSIDAPEIGNRGRPGQAYSQASRQALEKLLRGERVTAHCYETDSYDRNICDLRLENGESANRAMVSSGLAWANMEGRGKFMRDEALPGLQEAARAAGRGLWAQPSSAVAPWQWRYSCWRQGQCAQ